MIILVLAVIGFIVWHFIPERAAPKADPRFRRDARISADNPQWRDAVEEHCESPAETAFLRAMIDAHQLKGHAGTLSSDRLKLDLQVGQGSYRVDFLVNDWLVVEVDGAAWHSSPAQQSRDAKRDAYFTDLGYVVIRIPAKTVFQRPDDAVRAVNARLARGKPQLAEPVQLGGLERLAGTMRGINAGLSEFNKNVDRARVVGEAMKAPEAAFALERQVLAMAMESGIRQIKIDEYLDTPEKREAFEQNQKRSKDVLAHGASASGTPPAKLSLSFTDMIRPEKCQDPEIEEIIQARFTGLLDERAKIYSAARQKLDQDSRLRPIVMRKLIDVTCLPVAERLHGQERPQWRTLGEYVEWHNVLIHGHCNQLR